MNEVKYNTRDQTHYDNWQASAKRNRQLLVRLGKLEAKVKKAKKALSKSKKKKPVLSQHIFYGQDDSDEAPPQLDLQKLVNVLDVIRENTADGISIEVVVREV